MNTVLTEVWTKKRKQELWRGEKQHLWKAFLLLVPIACKISHFDNRSTKSLMVCKANCICGLNFIPSLRLWLRSYTKYLGNIFLWIFVTETRKRLIKSRQKYGSSFITMAITCTCYYGDMGTWKPTRMKC